MKNKGKKHHEPRIVLQGELLVTGKGELMIEEPVHPSRALFVGSTEAVVVEWGEEPPCPPCAPNEPDELQWEVYEWSVSRLPPGKKKHKSDHDKQKEHEHEEEENRERNAHRDGELFIVIKWHVNCARTIKWRVFEVD